MSKRDLALALVGAGTLVALGAACSVAFPGAAIGVVAGALFLGIVFFQAREARRLHARMADVESSVSQIEPMIALAKHLDARRPLPPMTEYAIAPDFALLLYQLVLDRSPRRIVETGSGVSTLVAAYALERLGGDGRVLALDHDASYAEKTRALLAEHGLSHRATVVHAPLEKRDVLGRPYLWYRADALRDVSDVDLVIDDGPPRYVGPMARYASLHVLAPKMRPDALFVLDVVGVEEKEVIRRWCAELPFEAELLHTRKGNVIFRRRTSSGEGSGPLELTGADRSSTSDAKAARPATEPAAALTRA